MCVYIYIYIILFKNGLLTTKSREGHGRYEKETQMKRIKYNKNERKGKVGYNVNRCVESLHIGIGLHIGLPK